MKRKIIAVITAAVLLAMQVTPVFADNENLEDAAPITGNYAEGEVLVVFDENVTERTIEKTAEKVDGECTDTCATNGALTAVIELEGANTLAAISKLNRDRKVKYAQPNYRYEFYDEASENGFDKESDYYQYQLEQLNVKGAWDMLEGNVKQKTKVAIIDTGVDVKHEDLQENLCDSVINNGYTKCVFGEKVSGEYCDAIAEGHGTHVAGIIGATYGNEKGGCGIASGYNNDLVDITVVGSSPDGDNLYTFDVLNAIDEAYNQGAKVVNMSFGGSSDDGLVEQLINKYTKENMVFVAAAGNEETADCVYPSDYANVISVSSVDESGSLSWFSNYGLAKDISASGGGILSTVPGDRYVKYDGTSMATPCITAICALMLDANPDMTPQQVKNVLCASTGKKFKEKKAYGIADAEAAVSASLNLSSEVAAEDFEIKSDSVARTVEEGNSVFLETLVRPASKKIDVSEFKWESSDESVAEVKDGIVTGIKAGKVIITAEYEGFKETCFVQVVPEATTTKIEIKNIGAVSNMEVGEYNEIELEIEPYQVNPEFYCESDNSDVLLVNIESGELIAKKEGTATITVYTENPATYMGEWIEGVNYISFTANVGKSAARVSFLNKTDRLLIGEEYTFSAEARTTTGTNDTARKIIEYSSTDESVLVVDETSGKATAVGQGIAYVRAYLKYSGVYLPIHAVTKVTVGKNCIEESDFDLKAGYDASSVTLNWNSIDACDGYTVFRSGGGNDISFDIESADINEYKDLTIEVGNKYEYYVCAKYHDGYIDGKSKVVSVTPKPSKPVLKVKNGKLTWSKVTGCTGYEIYYKAKSSNKYKKKATVTKTSYTGKNGWYKVRAYVETSNGKVYGSFSKVVRIK